MGIGQVLSDTFGVVKARFGSLLGLWAIYFGITIALYFGFAIAIGTAGIGTFAAMASGDSFDASTSFAAFGGMAVLVLLFYLAYLLLVLAQYASLITQASPLRQVTVGEALGAGWRAAPALLLLMIVLLVGYFVATIVLAVPGAALSSLGNWGIVLFAIVLVPLLVWLGCRLALLFSVMAVDGVRNPFKAIRRSWALTRGHALAIFLASLVLLLILAVVCGLALLPSIGVLAGFSDPATFADASSAIGAILLLLAGMLVISAAINLLYCAFLAVLHSTLTGAAGQGAAEAFA